MSESTARGREIAGEIRALLAQPGHIADHAAAALPKLRTDIQDARAAGVLTADPFVDRALDDLDTALSPDEHGKRSAKAADAARRILNAVARALG